MSQRKEPVLTGCLTMMLMILFTAGPVQGFADGDKDREEGRWDASRPDSHAPISVMGEHTHEAGEWMVSYRFMRMEMDGNRSGTDSLSTEEVLAQFPVSPLNMTMDMHMFGAMVAPSDNLTLMLMVPVIDLTMDHVTRSGASFTTEARHTGDIKLGAMYKLFDDHNSRVHLNIGMSLDTGSIDQRGNLPIGMNLRLPYPMQTGTGTWDFMPGITYLGQKERFSWGGQLRANLPTSDRNSNGYAVGDRFTSTLWGAVLLGKSTSVSFSLAGQDWDNYKGADEALNPNLVPTANPNLRGGTRWDAGFGLNYKLPRGHRLALDGQIPLQQDLEGPQLETDWQLTLGWQYAF